MKTLMVTVMLVAAMEILKRVFGVGVSLTIAIAALSFCVGALWGVGSAKQQSDEDRT